jgi:hypothetical protein
LSQGSSVMGFEHARMCRPEDPDPMHVPIGECGVSVAEFAELLGSQHFSSAAKWQRRRRTRSCTGAGHNRLLGRCTTPLDRIVAGRGVRRQEGRWGGSSDSSAGKWLTPSPDAAFPGADVTTRDAGKGRRSSNGGECDARGMRP